MLKHFLKITLRNFATQKAYSFINVLGLAIGLSSAILIYMYLNDELTYDTMHPDASQTYRMGLIYTNDDGDEEPVASVPGIWAKELTRRYSNVIASTRHFWLGYPVSIHNKEADKILLSENLHWVDSSYSKIMYLSLLSGDKESLFSAANSMAISESKAMALFGSTDIVGKTVELSHTFFQDQQFSTIISGVFEDYPSNSHMRPDYLVNMNILEPRFGENFHSQWDNWWLNSYVKVQAGTTAEELKGYTNQMLDERNDENREALAPFFTPITDLHFDTTVEWVTEGAGDINYLYIFGSIAILILIVASINYMNLATARSTRRAKEIGLRKTLGSDRTRLILQFLGESIITVFFSLLIAIIIVSIVIPYFNELSGKSFTFMDIWNPNIVLTALGACVIVSLLSGLYPALYLSSFHPVIVLNNRFTPGKGPELFRKILVTLQFSISVILIICTGIMFLQMNLIHTSKLSQAGDQMVSIRFGGNAPSEKYPVFKQEIVKDPSLPEVTMANHLPRQEYFGNIDFTFRFPGFDEKEYEWSLLNVEHNFMHMFDIELLAGRQFDKRLVSDSSVSAPFMVNEAAVKQLGLTNEEALGKAVNLDVGELQINGQVIGVVKDFPYRSIHSSIEPLFLTTWPHPVDKIVYVKLPKEDIAQKLEVLEEKWKAVFPGIGFDYWFIDEEFGRMYANEDRMTDLAKVFSLLAILVACLGVYGLASYLAERRMKEIGVRKILGASVGQIMVLLSQTFVSILVIASIIGIPLAYFLMDDWLESFVYKIDLSWWIFGASVLVIFLLAFFTASYETLRAARLDPAKYLREE